MSESWSRHFQESNLERILNLTSWEKHVSDPFRYQRKMHRDQCYSKENACFNLSVATENTTGPARELVAPVPERQAHFAPPPAFDPHKRDRLLLLPDVFAEDGNKPDTTQNVIDTTGERAPSPPK